MTHPAPPSHSNWAQLERQQRIEELFETYRFRASFPTECVASIRWDEWSALMWQGRVLSPSRLSSLAADHGVPLKFSPIAESVHGGLVHIDFSTPSHESFCALEEQLVTLLEGLREENPVRFLGREILEVRVPQSGAFPESAAFLARMTDDQFIPNEKKPVVVDLDRTRGAYMVGVDREPLVMLESMSQISTLPAGFTPAPVERALDNGEFDELVLHSSEQTQSARAATEALESELRATLPNALHNFCHTGSGAEANEKAIMLARLHGPGGRRVVAFEGSFHGRTLVSLYSTWNPEKRAPYEIAGYESLFAPFPPHVEPQREPEFGLDWVRLWASRDETAHHNALEAAATDLGLRREIESLLAVQTLLKRSDVCCVIVEPMQSEGGDNYGTARFFNGLRALTRAWATPLVFDEVQTGYGLGGPIWWHSRFSLRTADGAPDHPDVVTWAKKFQLGGLASVWPDPYPTAFQPAGALRGALHGLEIHAGHPEEVERMVYQHLYALQSELPEGLVSNPRALGYAFALDLPTPTIADKVVNQRFYRGVMVYKAGEHTLRYRLNTQFDSHTIARTFQAIRESLQGLVEWAGGIGQGGADLWSRMDRAPVPAWHPPKEPPPQSLRHQVMETLATQALDDTYAGWLVEQMTGGAESAGIKDAVAMVLGDVDEPTHEVACGLVGLDPSFGTPASAARRVLQSWGPRAAEFRAHTGISLARFAAHYLGVRVRHLEPTEWDSIKDEIYALQERVYEPARRDDPALLERAVCDPEFISVVAERENAGHWELVGFSFAGPLEAFSYVKGPHEDIMLERHNTLYSADVTVHPDFRGRGIGLRLKAVQVREAMLARTPEGAPRYAFITGRNRVGATPEMRGINERFGAYTASRYEGEYGEPDAVALYYRIPLRRTLSLARATAETQDDCTPANFADGLAAPLGYAPPELVWARQHGRFNTAAVTKLTLSNFVTPPFARYVEALRELAPASCRHLYITSCRGETVDKTIRALRIARPAASRACTFSGAFFGESTAAARSLSDFSEQPHAERMGWFDWVRTPHPSYTPSNASPLVCPSPNHTAGGVHAHRLDADFVRRFTGRLDTAAQVQQRLARVKSWLSELAESDADFVHEASAEAEAITALEGAWILHGPGSFLALFAEAVQERTGRTLRPRVWEALGRLCRAYDIPLVLSETASGSFRSANGHFWGHASLPVQPDAVLWFAGGQLGHIFISDRYFLSKPLQLISTWDGDELSARRLHWTLRALHRQPQIGESAAAFAHALRKGVEESDSAIGSAEPAELRTAGLFASLRHPQLSGARLLARLREHGVWAAPGASDRAIFWPPLNVSGRSLVQLRTAVARALTGGHS